MILAFQLNSEKIELSAQSIKRNKAGVNELNALETSNQETAKRKLNVNKIINKPKPHTFQKNL